MDARSTVSPRLSTVTGEIVDANPFVTKLFSYHRSQLVGSRFWNSGLFRDTTIDESLLAEVHRREAVQRTVIIIRHGVLAGGFNLLEKR